MIAIDSGVLTLDDILELADRLGRDIPDSLEMLWNEHEVSGIDVPRFNEARVLFGHRQGLFLFTRPHWWFMKLCRSRRARARHWRKLSAVISRTSAPTVSLAPRIAPSVKISRCLRSRQSNMPIVQEFLVSSTSSSISTGTLFGSGKSRSGVPSMAAP